MSNPRRAGIAASRYLWGGLAFVVLILLGLSLIASAPALEKAEADARQRAERVAADVLLEEVTPRSVSGEIVGSERRNLLEVTRARILDDRIARVRIWSPDGALIFSSASRDPETRIPEDHLQFSQAAGGVPASVVVEATATTPPLLQTFVPLRASGGGAPFAVAEIDQRHDAIRAHANGFWRPVQLVLLVALGAFAVLFALSFVLDRSPRPAVEILPAGDASKRVRTDAAATTTAELPAGTAPPIPSAPSEAVRSSGGDERLREAEDRARTAEERARRAELHREDAERSLKQAMTTLIPPDVVARIEELEAKLESEAAESQRSADEAQRLRSALQERQTELAQARDGGAQTRDAEVRAEDAERRALEAAGRVAEAEERAGKAERRAIEATDRIAASEARISELEAALRTAQEEAARTAKDAGKATREEKSKTTADLRASRREAKALKKQLAESEASLVDATSKLAERTAVVPQPGSAALEVELLRAERDVAKADLLRTQQELESMRERVAEMEARSPDESV
ncbi:MAG: hypothetical protein ACRDHC_00415 [Actinomycetota bacterium]